MRVSIGDIADLLELSPREIEELRKLHNDPKPKEVCKCIFRSPRGSFAVPLFCSYRHFPRYGYCTRFGSRFGYGSCVDCTFHHVRRLLYELGYESRFFYTRSASSFSTYKLVYVDRVVSFLLRFWLTSRVVRSLSPSRRLLLKSSCRCSRSVANAVTLSLMPVITLCR